VLLQSLQPAAGADNRLLLAALTMAQLDLKNGVKEAGYNMGPLIQKYFDEFKLQPPQNWCACACGYWFHLAARSLTVHPPIPFSPGAKSTMHQFEQAGRWIPAKDLIPALLVPGLVPVWHRGPPDSWTGHIGIYESLSGPRGFFAIEGNSGPHANAVARVLHSLDDPALLGMGYAGQFGALNPVS
jgi:hypothetical protein